MGKIYLVKQGVMKKNGDGDYDEIARFTNKAEALKKFNAIKHDTKGWSRSYDYLETMIEVFKSELKEFGISD